MLVVVLSCTFLTYGGVSLFVVAFAVVPIAEMLFRNNGLPNAGPVNDTVGRSHLSSQELPA